MTDGDTASRAGDPLDRAAIGETVSLEESVTVDTRDFYPFEKYTGQGREVGDIAVEDIEVADAEDGKRIHITWEGKVTKQLHPEWDCHCEPVTEEEKARQRRQEKTRLLTSSTAISGLACFAIAGVLSGETFPAPAVMRPWMALVFGGMLFLVIAAISWGALRFVMPDVVDQPQ